MNIIGKRSVAAITGVAMGVLTLTAPGAVSEAVEPECVVTAGSASWSIKDSYLRYLKSPATNGEVIVSDGVTIDDPGKGPFVFGVDAERSSVESASKAVFGLNGTIVIHGHKNGDKWELDQKISDVKVAVDGKSGQIIADYSSVKYPNREGDAPFVADDAVIANVTWDAAPNLVAGDVDLSGAKVLLTEKAAAELFSGFYQKDMEMAPLQVKTKLSGTCATPGAVPEPAHPEPTPPVIDEGDGGMRGSSIGPELFKTLLTNPVNGVMSIFVMIGAAAVFGVVLQHLVALLRR
ncbi:HtaA domain-containing protein [Corynebacterium sp. CCM 9204]|uniref:HtaA domain-containing protein n=1 Tax=Corynebacterium sp. CCM 9204 TaxID=3057616 RepID=UPI0035244BC2